MKKVKLIYKEGSDTFNGFVVYNENLEGRAPAILVAHAWRGQDNFARQKAEELAALGYVGFAIDLYGNGIEVSNEEAPKMMAPLFINRKLLRARALAAIKAISSHPKVQSKCLGAIGFCFGGLTVLEMGKSCDLLTGVVSFHGLLGTKIGELKAKTEKNIHPIKTKMLVLHGHNDPMVSKNDIARFQKEMTEAGVDWEMDIYGHTSHAFTNPQAADHDNGLVYNPVTAQRAWKRMEDFFEEIFPKRGSE